MLTIENLSPKNCFGTARNGKHYKICNSRPLPEPPEVK